MGTNTAKVLTANYRHDCHADCGQSISRGDAIVWQQDGFVHEDCYDALLDLPDKEPRHRDDKTTLQPGESPCTSCWLVHPGECF